MTRAEILACIVKARASLWVAEWRTRTGEDNDAKRRLWQVYRDLGDLLATIAPMGPEE